jgi:hypothetical protein
LRLIVIDEDESDDVAQGAEAASDGEVTEDITGR